MDSIRFQSFATQNAGQRMLALKQKWEETVCKAPESIEGKGPFFEEMQKIGEEYELLHGAISVLLANTLQFLQNTEEAFVSADEKMAEEIGG